MSYNDWLGFGLYIGFFIVVGLPTLLLKMCFDVPFEVTRKLYHIMITLSIFPLLIFNTWYMAVLAIGVFTVIAYPLLIGLKNTVFYRRIAVERADGEFKRSLIVVQVSLALVISVFWGLLGAEWKYIAVAAVLAWGFGDAAAALVGKRFGRRPIHHTRIEGTKTLEGTLAMTVVAGGALFLTLLIYAGQPWGVSLAVALLGAPVCAAVELFSHQGMDTLTVPISAGLAVLSWTAFFTFLGGLI